MTRSRHPAPRLGPEERGPVSEGIPTAQVTRLLRLKQIIGDRKAVPPIEPIIPVSSSTWWAGVSEGRFPAPVKIGPNTTAWRWEDIQAFLNQLDAGEGVR